MSENWISPSSSDTATRETALGLDADEMVIRVIQEGPFPPTVRWSAGERRGLQGFPPLLGAVLPLQGQDLSFSVGESKDLFE